MKVRYLGPSPARRMGDGQKAIRGGDPVEVTDELGDYLIRTGKWEAADKKPSKKKPERTEG